MRGRFAFAAAIAATALAGGAHGAGAQCPQPYLPVHEVAFGSGQSPPEGGPKLEESLAVSQPVLDTDGDGVSDRVEVDGALVRITRGSGVLELAVGSELEPAVAPRSLGDLDGDGRSELALVIGGTTVIVPGSTPDGRHDALSVGVRTWPGQQPGPWVGDQDGDGFDDIAVLELDPIRLVSVVSGADLVTAGAGGIVESRIAPIIALDADLHGLADLGQPAPTLLTYRWSQEPADGPEVGEVTVQLPETVRLRTAVVAAPRPDVFSLAGDRSGLVTAWTTADGNRAIVLTRTERGGGSVHVWDLDPPCAPASATTTTAPVVVPTEVQTSHDVLPRTGADGITVVALAGAAVVVLSALLLTRRSRSTSVGGRDRRP